MPKFKYTDGKYTDAKFKKALKKAKPEQFYNMYSELYLELMKLRAKPERFRGGLLEQTCMIKKLRRQIAQLLTVARQRGIYIKKDDIARLKARI